MTINKIATIQTTMIGVGVGGVFRRHIEDHDVVILIQHHVSRFGVHRGCCRERTVPEVEVLFVPVQLEHREFRRKHFPESPRGRRIR